jgi:hypothetical protein
MKHPPAWTGALRMFFGSNEGGVDEVDSTEHPVLPTRADAGVYDPANYAPPSFGLTSV